MASQVEDVLDSQRKRKPRPSRGRGLRTTTGCLTCRKRRLKCSEDRPICGQCSKSFRECLYGEDATSHADHDATVSPSLSKRESWDPIDTGFPCNLQSSPELSIASHRYSGAPQSTFAQNAVTIGPTSTGSITLSQDHYRPISQSFQPPSEEQAPSVGIQREQPHAVPATSPKDVDVSPVTQAASVTPGRAPYEWWDLVAHDAANSAQSYQALKDSHSRWNFEPVDVSRSGAPSPGQFLHSRHPSQEHTQQAQQISRPSSARGNGIGSNHDNVAKEPWNTSAPATMSEQELAYLKYYIDNVGPIFDLFDPRCTFTEQIPHLAMRNVGLLKSVLAVSARFKSLHTQVLVHDKSPSEEQRENPRSHKPSFTDDDDALSTQFYFETLNYLAKAMKYQSYTRSKEILATVALIISYEMFHVNRSTDWERHLRGVFWIQRSQETNGEREGLRGAVWWLWLRQDLWAALRQNRRPLTIWEPKKPVSGLHGHEFASRATFLLARAIKYAAQDTRDTTDLNTRSVEGDKQLQDLQEWYNNLSPNYRPLPAVIPEEPPALFPPVWIHPPFHAAAMQN